MKFAAFKTVAIVPAVIKNSEDFTEVASSLGFLKIDHSANVRNINSFYDNSRLIFIVETH